MLPVVLSTSSREAFWSRSSSTAFISPFAALLRSLRLRALGLWTDERYRLNRGEPGLAARRGDPDLTARRGEPDLDLHAAAVR